VGQGNYFYWVTFGQTELPQRYSLYVRYLLKLAIGEIDIALIQEPWVYGD
jgi:hypothetical protein